MSLAAQNAVAALLKITSTNSPIGSRIVQELASAERPSVMSRLIENMRQADWSMPVSGIHGAAILAKHSSEAQAALESFVSALPGTNMDKGVKYLLKQQKLLEG
jgi:hypothetical protein